MEQLIKRLAWAGAIMLLVGIILAFFWDPADYKAMFSRPVAEISLIELLFWMFIVVSIAKD